MGANRIIILVAIALVASAIYGSASAKEIVAGNGSEADFSSIQEAVNNSSPGDVILVLPGTYNESVDVRVEGLSILSESGNPEDTVVTAFSVSESNVTVSGFSITGGIGGGECFNCIFSDNMFSGSGIGLHPGGETTNVTIANNTIQGGFIGLGGSSGNRIINNTISNTISDTEDSYGIAFFEAHSNYVADNKISNSKYGISMVRLSGNNEIVNNTLTSNDIGISITDVALGNNITGNTITNNSIGIWQGESWGNLVTGNNVSLNKEYGVYLDLVSYEAPYTGTSLFYNNMFNNSVNLFNDTSNHYTAKVMNSGAGTVSVIWNTTKTSGTSIAGGPCLGGNFWAKPDGTGFSQSCNDWDVDGICESIYTVSVNDIDDLPLTVLADQQLVFPVANFSTNITSGHIPLSVRFTDLSQNATSRSWDLNNDGVADSSDANPVYVYTESGIYTVNLTVSNANGTVSRLSAITALPAPSIDGFNLRETQITANKSNQSQPAIYGDRIVWDDDRNGGGYVLYMCTLPDIKEAKISANGSWYWKPAIYGDRIVWRDDRNGNGDIYMYNISTSRETQITTDKSTQGDPAIHGDRIVWTDNRNGHGDIYMYDLSTSREIQITTDKSHQGNPAVYGDIIVWTDSRNGEGYNPTDIYMYNISTSRETRITTNDSDQYNPAIYGNRVVWADWRNNNWDIYMYDLTTSTETRITTDDSAQEFPAIYGDRVVWQDDRNGNYDIYMYNFSTQEEIQITTNRSSQVGPAIYDNRIVWTDYRNEEIRYGRSYVNADIYMCTVSGREPEPKTPIADFSASPISGYAPLKVLFTDNSTGSPTSWLWDFGNGIHSKHAMNATHTFTSPGMYNVTLTVTNTAGSNSVTKPGYITVTSSPSTGKTVADFYSPEAERVLDGPNDQGIFENKVVSFFDNSTGSPTSWFWDFGDGNTSKQKNPTHAYGKIGGYTVNLTVKNDVGSHTISKYGYVLMGIKDEPATPAYFSSDVTSGNAPFTVTFIDDLDAQFPNYPIWREWDFGDGVVQTYVVDDNDSATPYATHTYEKPGKYTVTLSLDNRGGKSIITKYQYVTVTAPDMIPDFPVANFSANLTSGNAPLLVKFTDTGTGGTPASWLWDFGDGIYSKHAMNATHTFTRPGVYDITLTVTNAAGNDTAKKSGYITVTALTAPVADFSANMTSGNIPLIVKFNDTSTGSPTSWYWDFGDGIYSKHAMNATHTYTRAGIYNVTLTVKNNAGSDTAKKTGYITVESE